jgi:hypothetical protein
MARATDYTSSAELVPAELGNNRSITATRPCPCRTMARHSVRLGCSFRVHPFRTHGTQGRNTTERAGIKFSTCYTSPQPQRRQAPINTPAKGVLISAAPPKEVKFKPRREKKFGRAFSFGVAFSAWFAGRGDRRKVALISRCRGFQAGVAFLPHQDLPAPAP